MHYFTIFTPTYNRAYTLEKLYNSLKIQEFKDFEWLIIDDGSTDETENLIKNFINENNLNIKYYKQKNQGKHIAFNNALTKAKSKYFMTIDSDDFLTKNALLSCYKITKNISNKKINGFKVLHTSETNYNKSAFNNKIFYNNENSNYDIKYEFIFVIETNVIQEFSFPIYKHENFCQESLLYIKLTNKYKIINTNYIVAHGEYLPDGLTQNVKKKLYQNPNYTLDTIKEKFYITESETDKQYLSNFYWDVLIKSKNLKQFKRFFDLPLKYNIKSIFKIIN